MHEQGVITARSGAVGSGPALEAMGRQLAKGSVARSRALHATSIVLAAALAACAIVYTPNDALTGRWALLGSAAVLTVFLVGMVRKHGVLSGGAVVSAALLLYFPARGVLFVLTRPGSEEGVNPRVLALLGGPDNAGADLAVLAIAASFVTGYLLVTLTRFGLRLPAREDRPPPNTALCLLALGCLGLVTKSAAALTFVQEGTSERGFLAAAMQALSLCVGLGIILAPRCLPGPQRSAFRLLVGGALGLGILGASKDIVVQVLLALALRRLLALDERRRGGANSRSGVLIVAALTGVVFVVFPAVNAYRHEIRAGTPPGEALVAVPRDLSENTIRRGTPRTDTSAPAYLADAALFLSNRLHGYDSLVLGIARGRDNTMLTSRMVVTSPLAIVVPARAVDPRNQDIGKMFAERYWGLPASNPTHIAIGMFTQGWIGLGWPMLVLLGAGLGAMTCAVDRLLRTRAVVGVAVAYPLLIGALSMERDLVSVVATTGRHLLVTAAVLALLVRRAGR